MPVIIVGEERTFSELRPRLLKGRISRDALRRVNDAVRDANPHVDLSRLERGAVLTIPDMPEIPMRADLSVDDITKRGIQEVATAFADGLKRAEESLKERAQADRSERTKVKRALKTSAVAEAKRKDRKLDSDLDAVAEALVEQDERAKERSAAFKKAARSWQEGLENLKSLVE